MKSWLGVQAFNNFKQLSPDKSMRRLQIEIATPPKKPCYSIGGPPPFPQQQQCLQEGSLFHHVTVILLFVICQGARASLGHIASHVPWSLWSPHARAPDSFTRLEAWGSNPLNICEHLYDLYKHGHWLIFWSDKFIATSVQFPELTHCITIYKCEHLWTTCLYSLLSYIYTVYDICIYKYIYARHFAWQYSPITIVIFPMPPRPCDISCSGPRPTAAGRCTPPPSVTNHHRHQENVANVQSCLHLAIGVNKQYSVSSLI